MEQTPGPAIAGGRFRDPEVERCFLGMRERTLRRQMAIVHLAVALHATTSHARRG